MFAFLMGLSPVRKIAAGAVGFLIVFGAGFAAAEIYEHRAPWGLSHKLAAAQARALEWEGAANTWKANRQGWFNYAKRLEGEREIENTKAATAVDTCSNDVDARSHTAYENGYAAGKRFGARQGASNANPSLPAGLRPSVGVLDPGAPDPFFGGDRAYRPAAPVPVRR